MDADLRLVIPLILLVVLGVLIVLLRALVAPLLLLGSVVLSFGAALGASALRLPRDRLPGARQVRAAATVSCSWSRWASTTRSS